MTISSVLVIGATGRTGVHILQQLAASDSAVTATQPEIFAFCRDPYKLDKNVAYLVTGAIQGNARNPRDLERALEDSRADLVVICVGNGDDVSKNDIRTKNAQALVQVLTSQPQYDHVRVLVVSSIGAGPSKIKAGFGIGKLIEFHLRHILHDHTGQEYAFSKDPSIQRRTMIVRPTGLTEGQPTGKVVTFGDVEKCPTMQTDREEIGRAHV